MPRPEGTEAMPDDRDARRETRPSILPPVILLDRQRIRALDEPPTTQSVDGTLHAGPTNDTGAPATRNHQWNGRHPNGLLAVRRAVPKNSWDRGPSFFAKQEWEGRVTAIRRDEFDARLRDLTGGGRHVATIELEEIGPEDRERMFVGSLFHWVMGYERSPGGTRSYVSRIVFLSPPRPTKRDLERGQRWADRLRAKWNLD